MNNNITVLIALSVAFLSSQALAIENGSEQPSPKRLFPYYAESSPTSSMWLEKTHVSTNATALVRALENSQIHGFNPDNYGLPAIKAELNQLEILSKFGANLFDSKHARKVKSFESKLDIAFSAYVKDLGEGMVDAQKVQKNLFRAAPSVDIQQLREKINDGTFTVNEAIRSVTPSAPIYTTMTQRMETLLLEHKNNRPRSKVELFDVELDYTHAAVPALKKRLMETGDLAEASQIDDVYDLNVEQALKSVQIRHGLQETGELNKATVKALNASVKEDITNLAMNLERWRWMPRELGHRHVMVNIPEYKVSLMNGDQRIVHMPVVVGSKKHKTAVFSDEIEFVEMAPTWTVPASITNNELIPLERRKPGYLKKEKIDFFTYVNGKLKRVDPSQVTEEDFNKKPFPYVLRQRAGEGNALGRLKILFPNKFAIYMHDTQAKKLFAKTDRAFSHGCIRLSDPFSMAGLLLQLDGKTPTATDKILALEETTRIRFKEKTPFHLTYLTSWIDGDGAFHKRKDVYGYNAKLKRALIAENSLIANLDKPAGGIVISEQLIDQ